MRITKLELSNLNSLKGKFDIDFTEKELIEDNIFAIVGDTGSGKSSILDAITLALFAKTARIDKITGASNEIMNRDSGDCYSKVFFTNDNCEYSALFSQRRARNKKDGNLLMYTRSLFDITNNKQLANNKDFDIVLERLINLTFDQFSRSVLLAQGDFNMFLIAKDDEKAKILEQITGTEIYSEIGKKIYEHFAIEKKNLELIDERVKSQNILSNDEKKEILHSIFENQKLIDELNNERLANDKVLSYFEKKASLDTKRDSLASDLEKRDKNSELYKFYKEKIELNSFTKEPLQLLKVINETTKKKEILDQEIELLSKDLIKLQNSISLKSVDLKNKENSLDKKKNDEIKLNEIISIVRPLDECISRDQVELNNIKKQKVKNDNEILNLEKLNKTTNEKIIEIKNLIDKSNDYLEKHQKHKILSDNYSDIVTNNNILQTNIKIIDELNNDVKTLTSAVETLSIEKNNQERKHVLIEEDIKKLNSENISNKSKESLKSSLNLLNKKNIELNKISDLIKQYNEDSSSLDIYENELCDKEIEKESNRIKHIELKKLFEKAKISLERGKELLKLSAFAHSVVEGQACPLCGSFNHPNPLTISEDALVAEDRDLTRISEELENLLAEKNAIDFRIATIKDNIKRLKSNVSKNKSLLINYLTDDLPFEDSYKNIKLDNNLNIKAVEKEIESFEEREKILNNLVSNNKIIIERLKNIRNSINEKELIKFESLNKIKDLERENLQLVEFFKPFLEFKNVSSKTLNIYKINYDANFNSLEKRKIELKSFKNEIKTNEKTITHKKIEKVDFEKELRQFEDSLALNKLERETLFGNKVCDAELLSLKSIIESLNVEIARSKDELSILGNKKAVTESKISSSNKNAIELGDIIYETSKKLNVLLTQIGFDSVKEMQNACLSDVDFNKYSKLIDEFESLVDKIKILEQSISYEEEKLVTEKPKKNKEEALFYKQKIDSNYDKLQQLKGNYQERIENDKKNVDKLGQIKIEREKQSIIYDRWSKLNSAVGSSDGQKFRKLAQGITLDYLLNNANIKLNSLTDRYSLIRQSDNSSTTLDISVIDLYMNGIERSVRNLSGGEKFLVSLSLALGLSELVNSNNPSETLFLDEGFGTLDEETLDNALNTLMILSEKEHKLIGIISHVEKVKQAISHQISVERNGNGSSLLKGPGVHSS